MWSFKEKPLCEREGNKDRVMWRKRKRERRDIEKYRKRKRTRKETLFFIQVFLLGVYWLLVSFKIWGFMLLKRFYALKTSPNEGNNLTWARPRKTLIAVEAAAGGGSILWKIKEIIISSSQFCCRHTCSYALCTHCYDRSLIIF